MWLKEYDDEGLVTSLSGQAVLTISMTNAFRKEQAVMAKAKAKGKQRATGKEILPINYPVCHYDPDCGTGSPTTYLNRGEHLFCYRLPTLQIWREYENPLLSPLGPKASTSKVPSHPGPAEDGDDSEDNGDED
jgi:hypothetical protein